MQVNTPAILSTVVEIVLPVATFDALEIISETSIYYYIMFMFTDYDYDSQKAYEMKWSSSMNIGYGTYNSI